MQVRKHIMRRGVVLPFTAQQRLSRDDHAGFQRFAASFPGARIDILISRNRQEIAVLSLAGRHVWIKRDGPSLRAHDTSSGQIIAKSTCIDGLLAAAKVVLLPDEMASSSGMLVVPHSAPSSRRPAGE